jgi:hypothetical protein
VPNPDYRLRAGLTTVVSVETETVLAHRVAPSLFTLDDDGVIGLRGGRSRQPRGLSIPSTLSRTPPTAPG